MKRWVGQGGGPLGALAMRYAHATGATAIASRLQGAPGCLLTFHRVIPAERWADLPNRDFHIDASFLGALLDYLTGTGRDVVTMDEVVSRIADGDRRPFVNISIDDVYRDTIEHALPVFRSRALPVTLFVTTGIPDRTMPMWTAGLETILMEQTTVRLEDGSTVETGAAADKRQLFARLTAAWEPDQPEQRYARFCALNQYDAAMLHDRHAVTWAMLDALRDDPLVEIGGHTVSHARLSSLPESEARAEIAGCRDRLQDRLQRPIRHFAFPYGRKHDCGEREFAITEEAGFTTAATTRKGLVSSADRGRLHALPRNTLNGSHRQTAQVEMHLSGLSGLAARAMRAT